MNLLLVHPGEGLASSRIRITQLAPHLDELGHRCSARAWPGTLVARSALAREARGFDAVVFHYKLPSLADGLLLERIGRPLVFDFDDALPFRQRPKHGSHESNTRRRRFQRMLRIADAFACGNRYLASLTESARKPTCILPSPVPVDVPVRSEGARPPGPVRIGWIGGRGNLASLDLVAPVLAQLAREHELRLAVIADAPYEAPNLPVEFVPWTLETQEQELARLDVGIMPLEDDPWTRGKCSYKLLQYMAAGVPVVASPVGMNADLVEEGRNGLLAADPEAWRRSLARLVTDAALRESLGEAGRADARAGYSYAAVARRWSSFLRELPGLDPR